MQLLDVAVLPWPPRETGVSDQSWSNLCISDRDSRSAGQGAWQVGPAMALTLTPTERAQADVLRGLIVQGQLTIDAAGRLTQAPLKPAPQGTPIVFDDRSPRYRDWDSSAIIGGDNSDGE
jgi:hypothetical protein